MPLVPEGIEKWTGDDTNPGGDESKDGGNPVSSPMVSSKRKKDGGNPVHSPMSSKKDGGNPVSRP